MRPALTVDHQRHGDCEQRDPSTNGQCPGLAEIVVDEGGSGQRGVQTGDAGGSGRHHRLELAVTAVQPQRGADQPGRDQSARDQAHRGCDPATAGGQREQEHQSQHRDPTTGPGQHLGGGHLGKGRTVRFAGVRLQLLEKHRRRRGRCLRAAGNFSASWSLIRHSGCSL